jgi:hypothetical protein
MVAKSKDPMAEGVKRILEAGAGLELPATATAADLEGLFLEELRGRRERLARWMQLIEDEVRREAAKPPSRSRARHYCRNRSACVCSSR